MRLLIFLSLLVTWIAGFGQLQGLVINEKNEILVQATIQTADSISFTFTDVDGRFSITSPDDSISIIVRFLGYQTLDTTFSVPFPSAVILRLSPLSSELQEVSVVAQKEVISSPKEPMGAYVRVDDASLVPSATMDFNQLIKTLPGVSGNNELSSGYQVRGGNFDENLVYVNDIPVYRPFLSNTGRQEGLSFVNPNLVKDLTFYAGGWEAKYGDKLSSSLNINYKQPNQLEGSFNLSMMGLDLYIGDRSNNERVTYLIGARHRNTRYLLNTLEVQGAYFPKFTDIQTFITFDLTKKESVQKNKTQLSWLNSYGRNRYLTIPESQTTEFGSVVKNLRIQTAFEGRETLDYDTYQTGFNLSHLFTERYASQLIGSWVHTSERENFEVEGAYRLCDVDNNPGSSSFDECVIVRGIGSQYDYGRNQLSADLISLENRNTWLLNDHQALEWGLGVNLTDIGDTINEFSFMDSTDYIRFTSVIANQLDLQYTNITGYGQYTYYSVDSTHRLHGGLRINYWTLNQETMISPRFNYIFKPDWIRTTEFTFSAGVYQQPPFYRELRNYTGNIDLSVRAQKSTHLILGMNRYFDMWERPFIFTSQIYYKRLNDLIPYEIDNLRLRYYADKTADGYATGIDLRLHGEFVPGTQSWFSFSYLNTKENILNDGYGSRRRPTDQRMQLSVYFEDHMPLDPTLRVYLNLQLGSGYPFGPPGNLALRNIFQGDEYYRADLGLSKSFTTKGKIFSTGFIRLEVLNAFGADNTLSYTWIQDVTGTSFAIPNSLSARLFNLRFNLKI